MSVLSLVAIGPPIWMPTLNRVLNFARVYSHFQFSDVASGRPKSRLRCSSMFVLSLVAITPLVWMPTLNRVLSFAQALSLPV